MELQKNSITQISMERTVCAGICPVYTVTFKSNGEAYYEGKDNVKRIGPYRGSIDETEFERLSKFIERLNFKDLDDKYSADKENQGNVIIRVNYGDITKRVDNYGDSGPVELWAVEKVIDALIEDIYWEQV